MGQFTSVAQACTVKFKPGGQGLLMEVNAPFFGDPPAPPWEVGQPWNGLWEYEGENFTVFSAKAERHEEYMLWGMAMFSYNIS